MHSLLFAAWLALAPDDPAELIREGDYAGAAAAFERQYEETGDPALLFGQAQALRRAGDCRGAIAAFERFVATDPPRADVDAANDAIEACREILAEDEAAVDDEPEPPPPPTPTPAPLRPWYTDPTGGVLVGLGLAIAVTGAGLFGASYTRVDDRPSSEADYEERSRVVKAMWGSGLGLLAAGSALIVGGAIRWGLVARKRVEIVPGSTITIRF